MPENPAILSQKHVAPASESVPYHSAVVARNQGLRLLGERRDSLTLALILANPTRKLLALFVGEAIVNRAAD